MNPPYRAVTGVGQEARFGGTPPAEFAHQVLGFDGCIRTCRSEGITHRNFFEFSLLAGGNLFWAISAQRAQHPFEHRSYCAEHMQSRHRRTRQVGFQGIYMHQPAVQHRFAPAVAGPFAQVGSDNQDQVHLLVFNGCHGGPVPGKSEHAAI